MFSCESKQQQQGTPQQRPESPTVTPPSVRVNTRYVNSTKGTASKKDVLSGIYTYTWTLLLYPLSLERYYFPLFVHSAQAP